MPKKLEGQVAAGSRGGPTKCRHFSRRIVDVVALFMQTRMWIPAAICLESK